MDDNSGDKSVCSSVVDLTDDAWLLVFSYLGVEDRIRVARVCSQWRELARISWKSNTRLWFVDLIELQRLSPQYTEQGVFTEAHSVVGRQGIKFVEFCLQQCGARLQCLDLSSVIGYPVTSRFLDLVGLHGASLQELNLSYSDLDNTALKTLADRLPRLRYLTLEDCNNLTEDGFRSALKMLQSLNSLNVKLSLHMKITGEFFSQAPQSLTEVLVDSCCCLTDEGVRVLSERCPNLEAIDISMCTKLTGQSIRHLAENCPKLKKLCCRGLTVVWNESTIVTLFNLPLLEELFVEPVDAMTDQVFCELSRHCPGLTTITLRGQCPNLTDDAFSHLCPWLHLESIDLSDCYQITDRGLIQLSSTHSELKKVGLHMFDRITDEGVGRLVSDHPNLLELEVSLCPLVTDLGLTLLSSIASHSELKKVTLRYCDGITDEGVGHLVSAFPKLLWLEVSYCPRVTDRVMALLESILQHRQHTQPLEIWLSLNVYPCNMSEKIDAFRENTRCIINGR